MLLPDLNEDRHVLRSVHRDLEMLGREGLVPFLENVIIEMQRQEILKVHHRKEKVREILLPGIVLRIPLLDNTLVAHVDVGIDLDHDRRTLVGLAALTVGLLDKSKLSASGSVVRDLRNQIQSRTKIVGNRHLVRQERTQLLDVGPFRGPLADDDVCAAPLHVHSSGYGTPE